MTKDLHITLVQTNLAWNQATLNRSRVEELLRQVEETDLIVLPEMFTTAFCMQANAESMQGESLAWMKRMAQQLESALCGSVIIEEEGLVYNRFLFVQPDGTVDQYDKRHLFSLMGEEERFTAGQEAVLINYKGWKIFPQICYDLRFPVFSRNSNEYDIAIYVANWPVRRVSAWDKLLMARAIENQAYVVGVNRVGEDGNGISFPGHSAAYDMFGEPLCFLGETEQVQGVVLSQQKLQEARQRLPFLGDRDDFTLSN